MILIFSSNSGQKREQAQFPKCLTVSFSVIIKNMVTAQEQSRSGINSSYSNTFLSQMSDVSSVDVLSGSLQAVCCKGSISLNEEKLCCSVLLEDTTLGFPVFPPLAS